MAFIVLVLVAAGGRGPFLYAGAGDEPSSRPGGHSAVALALSDGPELLLGALAPMDSVDAIVESIGADTMLSRPPFRYDEGVAPVPLSSQYSVGPSAAQPSDAAAFSLFSAQEWHVALACADAQCSTGAIPHTRSDPPSGSVALTALEVSMPNGPRSLPTPQSGWFDIGYTAPANPPWRQLLAGVCTTSQAAPSSALGVQCGLPPVSSVGMWRMSFQTTGLEGAFTARDWHVSVGRDGGINLLVASALQTPLDDFNVDPSWGAQLNLPGGFHLLGTASGVDLVQVDVPFGQVFGGVSPLGSFAGAEFDGESVSGNISALSSADGVQIIGDVSVQLGDVLLNSALSTSDFNIGLSRRLANRATVQLSWSASDGFGTAYMWPGGPTAKLSWSNDSGLKIAVISLLTFDPQPVTAPGRVALGFTRPDPLDPAPAVVDFRWPLPAPAQPGPGVSSASGSATIVIRFCVDGTGDTACRQADFRGPVLVSVDGQLISATAGRISLPPGGHVIIVPAELLPARVSPLGTLSCNLMVAASTVTFCDLLVRSLAP